MLPSTRNNQTTTFEAVFGYCKMLGNDRKGNKKGGCAFELSQGVSVVCRTKRKEDYGNRE